MPTANTLSPLLLRRLQSRRRAPDDRIVGYGIGYNPAWPSILSVAHDEADGGALFVITDRPCVLLGTGLVLPLSVAGLVILDAHAILPIKFRLVMSGAVPQGAAWQWAVGSCDLIDPITGHAPNPATGNCADVPGPYAPATPATVIGATATGSTCQLVFDIPVSLNGNPPDGAITINGSAVTGAMQYDAVTIELSNGGVINPGGSWNINSQPDWISTPLNNPAGGVFA